jgi:hypothetical protein
MEEWLDGWILPAFHPITPDSWDVPHALFSRRNDIPQIPPKKLPLSNVVIIGFRIRRKIVVDTNSDKIE